MILTDAGPLVAPIDAGEEDHARFVAARMVFNLPMVTTWPAFTEATYLLGRAGGWRAQAALRAMLDRRDLQIAELPSVAIARMRTLMEQYRDLPMDVADVSPVALVEERGLTRIFTLDSDFQVYRLPRGRTFSTVP